MSEDRDDRLVEFLCAAAPPPRDPVFRLRVLERREHRQFRRRLFTMLAGVLVILLVSAFAIRMGGRALETMGALAVGAALASAYLAFRGRLLRILRRFSF
jgi:hypothetical protein